MADDLEDPATIQLRLVLALSRLSDMGAGAAVGRVIVYGCGAETATQCMIVYGSGAR
ncbi:hypothetical protein [Hamadaea tsunoensis]|uniref:hypothetical protein n=1 Tax=Hamadaea tsunoensis TaxID=53368 RepID=UPI0012FC1B1C|nr:hypothetical protein [Hamadaea tsunoensis]